MGIEYRSGKDVTAEQVAGVFRESGIRRPVDDLERIARMIDNADVIVTAWDGDYLAGIARAVTDFSYCCYLSDLAVDRAHQNSGIGRELIALVRNMLGDDVALILLSAPNAMEYYPKVGFAKADNAFIIPRKRHV